MFDIMNIIDGKVSFSKDLEKEVLETGTASDLYNFAEHFNDRVNVLAFEDAIIKSGSSKYAFYFAAYVNGANFNRLQDFIIASKDAYNMYRLARYAKGADMLKLAHEVLTIGDLEDIYRFYENCFGVNLEFLKEYILNSGNQYFIDLINKLGACKCVMCKNIPN